jgi:hypothetical protein
MKNFAKWLPIALSTVLCASAFAGSAALLTFNADGSTAAPTVSLSMSEDGASGTVSRDVQAFIPDMSLGMIGFDNTTGSSSVHIDSVNGPSFLHVAFDGADISDRRIQLGQADGATYAFAGGLMDDLKFTVSADPGTPKGSYTVDVTISNGSEQGVLPIVVNVL